MRILITSDNHLGYKEADPIRGEDTFNTFEEILELARREEVDLLLQGGDLFEDNKPSRNTYNRTLQLLKKYGLGTKTPRIQTDTEMNWHNPSMQISLPILSIHGNHDDPSGFGSVSPHDILSSAGLLNHFGKIVFDDSGQATLDPILITDSSSAKIAIYGLGFINNRHSFRLFTQNKLKFNRPASDGWFNLLILHQNRIPRESEYVPEDSIPSFFDLVVYGHEHECLRFFHKNFEVLQSGSTVRTSLCDGETGEKAIHILEIIDGLAHNLRRIPLKSVRPLLMASLKVEKNPETQIKDKLEQMIRYGKDTDNTDEQIYKLLPLIRLRVDLYDCDINHKEELINYLEGRVANVKEALRIVKHKEKKREIRGEHINSKTIFEIYGEILDEADFGIFQKPTIIAAFQDFLKKECKESFVAALDKAINKVVEYLDLEGAVLENLPEMIHSASIAISTTEQAGKRENYSEESESNLDASSEKSVKTCKESVADEVRDPSLSDISFISSRTKSENTLESAKDYTFLECKQAADENMEIVKRLKNEYDKNDQDSNEELISFSKYL